MSEAWKRGDDRGSSKFGKKAKAWLRRQLAEKLRKTKAEWGKATLEGVVNWFLDWDGEDTPGPFYVEWKDEDEFRGSRYANGAWVVLWDCVMEDLPLAIRAAEREEALRDAAQQFPSLDAWLRADMKGELEYRGALGGMQDVPDDVRAQVQAAARARAQRRPVVCTCGATFKRDRSNARRCPECREIARAKKSAG